MTDGSKPFCLILSDSCNSGTDGLSDTAPKLLDITLVTADYVLAWRRRKVLHKKIASLNELVQDMLLL